MSTTYSVVVDLSTRGSLDAALGTAATKGNALDASLGRARGSASSIGSAFSGMGAQLSALGTAAAGVFTGMVERAADVAMTFGKLGAVGAVAGLAYGVVGVNNELEKTQISLAAIFGANGISKDMNQGMDIAAGTMAQMRKDAAALPGETKDLVGIFKDISVPAFQAGASVDKVRDLSAKTMATGAVLGLPMDQMGREMAMLLEGRAGAHNVAGMRLAGLGGEKAQKFNKLGAAERVEFLTKELDKFAPAIAKYGDSFDGLKSTMVDSAKKFLGEGTAPLFGRIKSTLADINGYADKNADKLSSLAYSWGTHIANAFDTGVAKIKEWTPYVLTFVDTLRTGIGNMWDTAAPFLRKLEDIGKNFLKDPAALDKIGDMLKLYAGLKIGVPVAGAAMGAASSMGGIGKAIGGAAGMGAEAGPIGLIAVVGMLTTLAEVAFVAGGALSALTDSTSIMHDKAVGYWKDIQATVASMQPQLDALGNQLKLTAEIAGTQLLGALAGTINALSSFCAWIENVGATANKLLHAGEPTLGKDPSDFLDGYSARQVEVTSTVGSVVARALADAPKTKGGAGGGGGGTHIAKVEIVVNSSEDPSRVARKVLDVMIEKTRNPTSSRYATNYSAGRT